jgi:hypothetical protein
MNTKAKKRLVQGSILSALFFCLIKSKSSSLIITSYLVIVLTIMDAFLYIRNEEFNDAKDPGKNFWIQTLMALLFQILIIASVFGLTWYVIERKLK